MLRGGALRVSPSVDHFHAVDERGALLRASWHHEHGFVNVSLWRGETCVETFRLEPAEAARLVAFLSGAVASSMPPPRPRLGLVGEEPSAVERAVSDPPSERRSSVWQLVASSFDRLAERLR